jgi:S-DNA-T family DNA segregation ATPase FtsK/SpoIIIE
VTSKHDSRTILDQIGAEHLLGRGDMLYKPGSGRLLRLHGPFLSDEEVQSVVNHWKQHLPPSYKIDLAEWNSETTSQTNFDGEGNTGDDALYVQVRSFVEEFGKASISLIQRRFKIGFNRAARLVEQLEKDGIIGPADGSKPRPVVK